MDQDYSEAFGTEAEGEKPAAEQPVPEEAPETEQENKPVMSLEERARQAAGRRLRQREAAARSVSSSASAPSQRMTTWLPWLFCTWSQRSPFRAVFSVSWSFWRLLRPTRISKPAGER